MTGERIEHGLQRSLLPMYAPTTPMPYADAARCAAAGFRVRDLYHSPNDPRFVKYICGTKTWFLSDSTGELKMHIAEREIGDCGEVEIMIAQLDAVSGGRVLISADAMGAFRNGVIQGFCGAGGWTSPGPTGIDFNKGGQTIHG